MAWCVCAGPRFKRLAHRREMFWHGAAASADYCRPVVARHFSIIGHKFWGSVIVNMTVDIFWNSGIAFGDQCLR